MVGQLAVSFVIFVNTVLLIPASVLLLQTFACFFLRPRKMHLADDRPPVVVLVPAHDEAAVIGEMLSCTREQMTIADRLVVVADNCSDETEAVAKAAGVEVVVRRDESHIGKGYALEAGVRHIARTGPRDVIVFLDADCILDPGALSCMARACVGRSSAIQACYVMSNPPDSDSSARVAEFAWRIRTLVRPSGLANLGFPCHLMGSGMALPWSVTRMADLGTAHLAEDVLLGIQLARSGVPAWFCADARITSKFPRRQKGRNSQRRRWIHGFFALLKGAVPGLMGDALRHRSLQMSALAVDLMVPPLSVLLALQTLGLFFAIAAASIVALSVSLIGMLFLAVAIAICWYFVARDLVGWREVMALPRHSGTVGLIVFNYLLGNVSAWTRSERD
ncbi:glycosyltransferase family 2 protein [Mesorhizobium sp.]|uniref:glycosyltransferase family 2 protein n=1 Tax=Mesorhizobium TaxID=68287 RepID=UPI000FE43801|nr:glycosyltransferase family 2 protein [Mesorhizobium sp.]RWC01487.1 MAG: glycosyltransferase [Mesorhizobium sp.]RWP07920.1 MAG: glycosyltransferase [Mesorhizobium sp.]RWP70000.1 MAG: glycosyltransferase [Mesorhizobium sp.]RWQ07246.1 MAG: glycosyltransferase [Mesorhizobium sp.]RWQ22683.1 MAG: glycosyltransferase [Mesorhizobium sp.]